MIFFIIVNVRLTNKQQQTTAAYLFLPPNSRVTMLLKLSAYGTCQLFVSQARFPLRAERAPYGLRLTHNDKMHRSSSTSKESAERAELVKIVKRLVSFKQMERCPYGDRSTSNYKLHRVLPRNGLTE